MDREQTGGPRTETIRMRRRRTFRRFPRVHVRSRAELAHELREWRWLLDKHAEAEFGTGDAATEAVQATLVKLLSVEEPDFPHHRVE